MAKRELPPGRYYLSDVIEQAGQLVRQPDENLDDVVQSIKEATVALSDARIALGLEERH